MYSATIESFAEQTVKKIKLLHKRPFAILIGGLLAGVYVGFGIILIMTLGTAAPDEVRGLIMGATFAIALALVIFAGAELFTGYTMYATFAVLSKRCSILNAIQICATVWLANLLGAILLALLYKLAGGELIKTSNTVLQLIAHKKINTPAMELFFKGVLCNWLVCLAIWITARMTSDTAKCIIIFWCLLTFIASGYEHSVANMAVFSLALLGPEVSGINMIGAMTNLCWVTLGNTVSGILFLGFAYSYVEQPSH